MDNESRSLKRRWKDRQLVAARLRFPLPEPRMAELFAGLAEAIDLEKCDHTLRITRGFLATHQLDPKPIIEWIEDHGGYCDCEVLLNAAHHFEELRTPD